MGVEEKHYPGVVGKTGANKPALQHCWVAGNGMSRRRFLKLAAAAGSGLVLGACGDQQQQGSENEPEAGPPRRGGTLRVGLSSDVSAFEPHVSTGAASNMIRIMVYSTLLTYDKQGELTGDLAEDFGWADDRTFEFKLRKGVQFHNGDELTAEDVLFTFQRIRDPKTAADLADRLSNVEVEAGEGNVIRLRLEQPNAVLPYLLADPSSAIVSKKWIESDVDPKTEAMGTGPFKFIERVPGVSIKLERHNNYFISELPYLDGINIQPSPEDNTRVNNLRAGSVDFIDYVPYTTMDMIESSSNLVLKSDTVLGFGWLGFVVNQRPVDDLKIRQAFAYGMDREKMVQTAFGGHGQAITGGYVPEGWVGYSPDLEGAYEPDYDRSKKLLQEAGLSKLQIDILSTSTYSVIARPAEAAQAELKQANINGKLVMQEWPTFLDSVEAGTHSVHVWGSTPDFNDPDFLSDYIGSDGWFAKYINFKDEKIDQLLLEGRRTVGSPEKRGEIYHDVQERMLELLPWALLIRREQGEAMHSKVKGYTHLAAGGWSMITLRETWLDE